LLLATTQVMLGDKETRFAQLGRLNPELSTIHTLQQFIRSDVPHVEQDQMVNPVLLCGRFLTP